MFLNIVKLQHKGDLTKQKVRENINNATGLIWKQTLMLNKCLSKISNTNKWKELNSPSLGSKDTLCSERWLSPTFFIRVSRKHFGISNTFNVLSSLENNFEVPSNMSDKEPITLGNMTIWENRPSCTLNSNVWEIRSNISANEEIRKKCVRYK